MAGSWGSLVIRKGYLNSAPAKPYGLEYELTADSANGSIPDLSKVEISGYLVAIDVVFDSTTPPDTITVVFKTSDGIVLLASSALTSSGRIDVDPALPFSDGFIITCSGNSTNSAKAKIILLVVPA